MRLFIGYIVIALTIAADQITKYIIRTNMTLGETIPVIENVFHITYVRNTGAAFGIMQGQTVFLVTVTTILLSAVLIFYHKRTKGCHFTLPFALALIFGGGAGNFIDRVWVGYVVDFLDFRVFPIFNAADIFVTTGCALLIVYVLIFERNKGDTKPELDADEAGLTEPAEEAEEESMAAADGDEEEAPEPAELTEPVENMEDESSKTPESENSEISENDNPKTGEPGVQ